MEAGVVEPIRNRNGEATDEWFGTLKPDTGNEYRVVKLVSPIVIYWEGETPRSIPGVYIVGNTGVKEIYSADGTLQINTGRDADVIENSDTTEKPAKEKEAKKTQKEKTSKDSSTETGIGAESEKVESNIPQMSDAEMASHMGAMEMYVEDDEEFSTYELHAQPQHENDKAEEDIPRPKPKKPTLIKTENKTPAPPPKLETYELDTEVDKGDGQQETNDEKRASTNDRETLSLKESGSSNKQEKPNKTAKHKANNVQKKSIAEPQNVESEAGKQSKSANKQGAVTELSGTNKQKRKRLNQSEEKVSKFLTEELSQKMSNGDVVFIDGTFALSVGAITEMTDTDYMQALPQLKARNIISDERGIRKTPLLASTPIWAFMPKYHSLPFLV